MNVTSNLLSYISEVAYFAKHILVNRFSGVIFYFLLSFFVSQITFAHDLLCKNWLNGKEDPSNENQSLDSQGVKGVCRDFFPTFGEREKLERSNTDPFEARYVVTRQYCWARFIFDSELRCGAPRMVGFFQFSWDSPAYTLWGDTKTGSVGIESTKDCSSDKNDINIYGIFNKARVCSFGPGAEYAHGGKNNTNRTKVCAYYVSSFGGIIGRVSFANALIGCIDAPLMPGPPTFNSVLSPSSEPYVDTSINIKKLIALGSSFEQPVIRMMTTKNSTEAGEKISDNILIKYKFDGDTSDGGIPNIPQCASFPDLSTIKYCAKVAPDRPGEVCACVEPECKDNIFLGCVPRPTPAQSNVAIVPEYIVDTDDLENPYPAINLIFARARDGTPIMRDQDNSEVYQGKDGIFYKLDSNGTQTQNQAAPYPNPKQPFKYDRLPLSKEDSPIIIREYYKKQFTQQDPDGSSVTNELLSRDEKGLYGMQFNSIIPKFDDSGEIEKIKVLTAQMRSQEGGDGCTACTTESPGSDYPEHIVPSGIRDVSLCCSPSIPLKDQLNKCIVPNYSTQTCIDKSGTQPERDTNAERAVCPGIYVGAECDTVDKICLVNQSDQWDEAMPKPLCVLIPQKCDAINSPTESSGYTTWAEADKGQVQTGACDAEYGVVEQMEIDFKIKDGTLSSTEAIKAQEEFVKFRDAYESAKGKAKLENRNVQPGELPQTQYLTITQNTLKPQRTCKGSIFSQVTNPCVYTNGCPSITKPAPITGNTTWADSSSAYKQNKGKYTQDQGSGIGTNQTSVTSTCKEPYPEKLSTSDPTRICTTRYQSDVGSGTLINQFWSKADNICKKKTPDSQD